MGETETPQRPSADRSIAVGIVPVDERLARDELFNPESPLNRDEGNEIWRRLRSEASRLGIEIHTWDLVPGARAVISWDQIVDRPDAPWLAYVGESPVVRPDLYRSFDAIVAKADRVFTHSLELSMRSDNAVHFSLPQHFPDNVKELRTRDDRALLVMVNANKQPRVWRRENYTMRLRVAAWLARHDAIDVFGPGWDRTLRGYGLWTHHVRRRWQGVVRSKHELLSRYDFCVAFDNASAAGYITEKVFDPMSVGCIPIYYGAPEIADVLPPLTYLDYRTIGSPRKLLARIESMSEEEKVRRRQAMRAYLSSPEFQLRFSVGAWTRQLFAQLMDVIGIEFGQ